MTRILINVEDLTRTFGNFTAVKAISFTVQEGEIFGFLGANGAGKTTAMKMLTGLLRPTSGQASIVDFDVYRQTDEIKKHIGYMSQRFSLYEDLTVVENIRFYGGIYGLSRQRIKEQISMMVQKLQLEKVQHQLIKALPLGWRQKLAFSVAMIHDPKIVFLDEPTSGVDPLIRRQFWELIYEAANRGITIFVTTHYMDEAEYCHRISMMVDGEIKALDTPLLLKRRFQATTMHEVFLKLARGV